MSAAASIRYHVTGMDCSSCAAKVEGAARKVEGVADVKVSIASQIMTLDVDDPRARLPAVEQAVTSLGYQLDRIGTSNAAGAADDDKVPDLSHVTPAYKRALWIVVLLNAGYGVVEIAGSILAGSQALQADALDFIGDGAISFLGLIAVGWGACGPSQGGAAARRLSRAARLRRDRLNPLPRLRRARAANLSDGQLRGRGLHRQHTGGRRADPA